MSPFISPVVVLMKGRAGLPCASCLFDLGEASGMVGAETCPLKGALLRRRAGHKLAGDHRGETSCGAFTPGFCEADSDAIFATDAVELRAGLS